MKKYSYLFLLLLVLMHIGVFFLGLGHFTGLLLRFSTGYLIHFVGFFILSFILSVFLMQRGIGLFASLNICWIYTLLFSFAFEKIQTYFHREFNPLGIVVAVFASILYCIIAKVIFRNRKIKDWILGL
jgi:hypothetical protein